MVTIPTIDQISGSTVMNKMRSLINAFINFANEVDTALTVTIPEYVDDALASYYTQTEINDMLDNYYTKSEVYTKTDVYTKSEVNNLLDDALSHYYTQTQTDTLLSGKADTFILHEPLFFDTDLQDNKYIYMKRGNGITVDQLDGGKLIANIDGDTIQFDSDGKMYCTVEGATYTAGSGISISNTNEISVSNPWVESSLNEFLSNYNQYEFLFKINGDFCVYRDESNSFNSYKYIPIGNGFLMLNTTGTRKYITTVTPANTYITVNLSDIIIKDASDGTIVNSSNYTTYFSNGSGGQLLKDVIINIKLTSQDSFTIPTYNTIPSPNGNGRVKTMWGYIDVVNYNAVIYCGWVNIATLYNAFRDSATTISITFSLNGQSNKTISASDVTVKRRTKL